MVFWQLAVIAIVFFVVILACIYFVLRTIFSHHLTSGLKRMQDLHSQNLEREVSLNKELERAIHERQAEIAKGKEEADKLKAQARLDAEKVRTQILAEAGREKENALKEAKQECERLKKEALSTIEESGIKIAGTIIQGIFSDKARQELGRELVDELIEELRKVDKEKLKVKTKKAEITSSYPLLENQKKAIKDILQGVVGNDVQIEEKVDPAIISGLLINLGGVMLDGSLSNKMRKAISSLQQND